MLEIGVDALGVDAVANPDAGEVVTQVVGGIQLPLAIPGTNEAMKIPSTIINFALNKKAALAYAELLKKQAESLPDEESSSILTANSLQDVERLAKLQESLTKR